MVLEETQLRPCVYEVPALVGIFSRACLGLGHSGTAFILLRVTSVPLALFLKCMVTFRVREERAKKEERENRGEWE